MNFLRTLLWLASASALCAVYAPAQVAVKYNGANSRRTEPTDLKTPTGMAETFEAGSTLTINGTLAGTPAAGTLNLSNLTLTLPAGLGTGTVTSFSAGDLSPLFTTSEATATTTPALTFALTNAAQNAFFAGPATGGAGAPVYRAIVAADIPTLNQSTTGSAATLTTGRTIGMTGDVVWTSPSFDGSGNVTAAGTIQADAVALTTDTTGDYVATITGDSEITVSGAGTEGRAVTLALAAAIARDSEVASAINALSSVYQPLDSDLTTWAGITPGTGIAAALAINTGSAGAPVLLNGAGGTPSSLTLTNATGLPSAGIAAATLVIESEGIASNDNDTTLPTSAAVKDYADVAIIAERTATATLTGKTVAHAAAPGSDDTFTGDTITGLNNTGGVTQWDAVYLNGSSQWAVADANGTGTYPAAGLAIATVSTGNATAVLVRGVVRNDAWTWTPGGRLYLSATAGGLTQTAPATSGDKVQDVGFALSADVAWINFDGVFVEVD